MLQKTRVFMCWFLPFAIALLSWRFIPLGVEKAMEFMAFHLETRAVALYTHLLIAPVVLIITPFQFSDKFRSRRPHVHRLMGRIYGAGVVLSGIAALVLSFDSMGGPVAGWGFGILAVLWIGATLWAIRMAMTGRYTQHKIWMIRSAALTWAAVTLRLYLPFLMLGFGQETGYVMVAWLCWVPNVLIGEWLVYRMVKRKPAAVL